MVIVNLMMKKYKDLCDDIADLLDNDYIDYNCDKYIPTIIQNLIVYLMYMKLKYIIRILKMSPYNISESRVDHILSVNDKCLMSAFEDKKKFSKKVSENVFNFYYIK